MIDSRRLTRRQLVTEITHELQSGSGDAAVGRHGARLGVGRRRLDAVATDVRDERWARFGVGRGRVADQSAFHLTIVDH